ncbi:hypothetical protein ACFV2H_06415 [Streptomyces sp. NPDC059629]|uniref:hypothetical protein n=1 Tax=Streptomyces sp. NPDC059629 TaxID=3346889 RepID=UPI0036BA26B5
MGLAVVAVHILVALLAPLLTSYDPIADDASHVLLGPSRGNTGPAPTSTAVTSSPGCCTAAGTRSGCPSPPL